MFIKNNDSHILIDFDINAIEEKLPNGIYKLEVGQNIQFFEFDFDNLPELKGKEYFRIKDKVLRREASVLLLGKQGFGKSLLMKHLAKEFAKKYPVIIVDRVDVDVLKSIANRIDKAVFLFDEFEKNFPYLVDVRDYDSDDFKFSQEALLSLLDGVHKKHIFILTANNEEKISPFIFQRPGRVRYVFRFEKVPEDIIEDNKLFTEKEKEYLKMLNDYGFVNFDILTYLDEEKQHGYNIFESLTDLGLNNTFFDIFLNYDIDEMYYMSGDGKKEKCSIEECYILPDGKRMRIKFLDEDNYSEKMTIDINRFNKNTATIKVGNYYITFKEKELK